MLTPYTPASKALTKGKPAKKKAQQTSLWGSWSSKKPVPAGEKDLTGVDLHELTDLWTIRAKGLGFEDVKRLEGKCKDLGAAVKRSVAHHYGKLKDGGLKRPADVAVYFALRDLGKKVKKEEPKFEAQFVDLAIEQIV